MWRECLNRFAWGLLCVVGFIHQVDAQELEFVELGVIEGEFKSIARTLSWINTGHETVNVHIWTDSPLLKSSLLESRVPAGSTIDIPVRLLLPETAGDHEYELRLLDDRDFLLHGFQFSLKVLHSELDVFKAYRNVHWPFRTKEEVFNLRAGMRQDTLKATFDVYNLGGSDLDLGTMSIGDSLLVTFEPKVIPHNQFGKMAIQLFSKDNSSIGFQKQVIKLSQEGKLVATLPIQYTLLPKRGEEGPQLTTSIVNQDFKVVKRGEKREVEIALVNKGVSPLLIEKIESNCDCLTFNDIKEIDAGESATLKVIFNAQGRMGLERKTIAIFSNDPNRPVQVLTFRAHVK